MKIKLFICILSFNTVISSCGQIIQGEITDIQLLLRRANKNIQTAESTDDINRKNELLKRAQSQINEAEKISKKETVLYNEVALAYAYFFLASGDYVKAKEYAAVSKTNNKDLTAEILKIRINLHENGKKYAREAIDVLEQLQKKNPDKSITHLIAGDSYLLLGDLSDARQHYTNVLLIDADYQRHAANRLELLDQIEQTGMSNQDIYNTLFPVSVVKK